MGKVLLTLFYHPNEGHAAGVCKRIEQEDFNGNAIRYKYSSPNGQSPDSHLRQSAINQECDCILTIHSDEIGPLNYLAFIFSDKKEPYDTLFSRLQQRFERGTYGFDKPHTRPTQIDLELGERNSQELSVEIVKELVSLLA